MPYSSILDVAIGLVFVYLLLSLIVTAATELVAAWLKRRHEYLWQGLVNLLGSKCAEELYDHALIKGLSAPVLQLRLADVFAGHIPGDGLSSPPAGKPALWKRLTLVIQWLYESVNVKDSGPAYIPSRVFVISLLDTVRFNSGTSSANELVRVLNAFPADIIDVPALKNALLAAASASPPDGPDANREFYELLHSISDSASPAAVKQAVMGFLDGTLANPLHALPAHFDPKLTETLQSLWNAAGHDVEKFKSNLEKWFDDSMDRVSGWYKRETQIVNLVLALLITLAINVDTLLIVNALGTNPTLRESIVGEARNFAVQPPVQLQFTPNGSAGAINSTSAQELGVSATNQLFSLSIYPGTVVSGEDLKGGLTLKQTNGEDITFHLSSSDTNLVNVPPSVTVYRGQLSTEFKLETQPAVNPKRVDITASNLVATLHILANPLAQFNAVQTRLENLGLPLGWVLETNKPSPSSRTNGATTHVQAIPSSVPAPSDRYYQLYLVLVPPTHKLFWSTIAYHFAGWMLTAIAISLGAPFWFDLLVKFISIRSSGDTPEDRARQNVSVGRKQN